MTSKIKVDNINKVSDDSNIIKKCGTTITLGASGDSIALASGASQTGFGRTGTVDWNTTPKTTGTFSAVSGDGFFLNTSGGVITANLPAGVAGAIVSFADYASTWQTNNVTVVPNGTEKINGVNANAILSTQGQSITLIYVDSTQGWINTMDSTSNVTGNIPFLTASVSGACNTLTTSGNCKIATFTGPGTFTVCQAATSPANNEISYLLVAGGGGGGAGATTAMGGGGAGGFREVKSPLTPYTASPLCGYGTPGNRITVTAQGYPIVVGGGGTAGKHNTPGGPSQAPGTPGVNSTAFGLASAGGGQGSYLCTGPLAYGAAGGSGGGGGPGPFTGTGSYYNGPGCAGAGNTPSVTPSQGTAGGTGFVIYNTPSGNTNIVGGGGGGATGVGTDGTSSLPSRTPGGAGATTNITASPVAYAGGGGGGALRQGPLSPGFPTGGTGGAGGGGAGGQCGDGGGSAAVAGTANTGGGGGGTGNQPGASSGTGGSGIVIIRYKFQ